MRWVLIRALNQSLFYDPETQEPLGIEYLTSVLKELGCQVLILDSALDHLQDIKLARRAVSFQPDVIGFSITTNRELDSVMAIYAECTKKMSEKSLLWLAGGNYVTCEYRNACEVLPLEFRLVKFEGEIFVRKVYALWNKLQINSLPRLTDGEPTADLDQLPFPQRPYHDYLKNFGWAFNVQGSRGCCSACKYCASRGMRGNKRLSWRGRSPENIVNELKYLNQTYKAVTFNFVDEDFLGFPVQAYERAKRFSAAIIENNLTVSFGIQVRPNSLSEEIIDVFALAGLKYVFMGIESDNPEDFKRWGRKFCPDTWRWVRYLQRKDIEINAGTLLFHPNSSFEGIRNFATQLDQHGLLNYRTVVNRMNALPGSFFYEQYLSACPDKRLQGTIQLPFVNPPMETFYQTVLHVLDPIEVPSMHVLCYKPIAQTNKIFKKKEKEYELLKSINLTCDKQVSSCFFLLLDMFETGLYSEQKINNLVKENGEFSQMITNQLIDNGFIASSDVNQKTSRLPLHSLLEPD